MTPRPRPDDALSGIPPLLWRGIQLATHRLLATDYDGTLAPFRVERDAAVADPSALAALRHIAASRGTEVAIVSGRPLAELERFLPDLAVHMSGEHGWEERGADGTCRRLPVPAFTQRALAQALRDATECGAAERVESKRTSLVLHTRGLPANEADTIESLLASRWGARAGPGGLRLDRIDGGLELRATQHDKGETLRRLIAAQPPGTITVFLGDDVTDEDGFEAAAACGFGVRVGEPRSTRAAGRLSDRAAVTRFLEEWVRLTGPGS